MSNNPFDTGYGSTSYGSISVGAADTMGRATPNQGGAGHQNGAPNATAANGDPVFDVTTQDFADKVLDASKTQIVLVDFWAAWCGPCKQLGPVLERVVRSYGGAVRLAKMDIDAHPAVAGQLGVQSLPTVLAFANGQPLDGFMGALPESEVKRFIDQMIERTGLKGAPAGLPVGELLAEATARMDANDVAGASEIYVAILSENPEEPRAVAGLASVRLAGGDATGARGMVDALPDKAKTTPEVAAVIARLDLAEQAASLGDPAALRARLDADPDDHDARYDLALIEDAMGHREAAADHLLEIMRRDREWREDGARQQLVKLFEAWGVMDPATVAARRKLTSLMFR